MNEIHEVILELVDISGVARRSQGAMTANVNSCRSSKRQPHTYRPRKHNSEYEAAPGGNRMRMALWQYGRFGEDAVPWRRLERVEDKRLPVQRIDEQSA